MRNLTTPSTTQRRGSTAGLQSFASAQQNRYKGLISTPGYIKFSAWKRENDIPKTGIHEFILSKIKTHDKDKLWMKDASTGRVENFGTVAASVGKLASALTKLGFGAKDVLCMYCSNYVEYWLLVLAAWSCGGCVMPVSFELDPDELEQQMAEAKAKILVCDDMNVGDATDLKSRLSHVTQVICMGSEGKDQGCALISDLLGDDGKKAPKKASVALDNDKAYLPFSSSSTGAKGIIHTHKSLISFFFQPDRTANHWFDQVLGDNVLCCNNFYHMTGLYSFALASIFGISLYCLSEYSNTAMLDCIVENKILNASLYNWQIRFLAQSPTVKRYDLSSLKVIVTGCGFLSGIVNQSVYEKIPSLKYVREAYGMNECGLITLTYPKEVKKNSIMGGGAKKIEPTDDHKIAVGYPNMFTQFKIIDRQTGDPVVGPDEQGEICVKTPQAMIGYLNKDDLTKECFDREGFYHTGDLGFYDGQGMVFFMEKISNIIHFWMYEVSPTSVESRLLSSDNIVDAAVVGVPHKEMGQVPRAFVVLKPGFEETEENLTNLIESRMEDHERIRGGMYFVTSIPRDENGKVRKDEIANYDPNEAEQPSIGGAGADDSKPAIKQLKKQADGKFVVPTEEDEAAVSSPRPRRRNKSKKGMASIREDDRKRSAGQGNAAVVKSSFTNAAGPGAIKFWLQVSLDPKALEQIVQTHPAVQDCVVRGIFTDGIGYLPRAYVQLKHGYSATADEILGFVHDRVSYAERIRAGIVLVDKLARDPNGVLVVALDKFDRSAAGMDTTLAKSQPKVDVSP